jgi:hypothetical protein
VLVRKVEHEQILSGGGGRWQPVGAVGELQMPIATGKPDESTVVPGMPVEAAEGFHADQVEVERRDGG